MAVVLLQSSFPDQMEVHKTVSMAQIKKLMLSYSEISFAWAHVAGTGDFFSHPACVTKENIWQAKEVIL